MNRQQRRARAAGQRRGRGDAGSWADVSDEDVDDLFDMVGRLLERLNKWADDQPELNAGELPAQRLLLVLLHTQALAQLHAAGAIEQGHCAAAAALGCHEAGHTAGEMARILVEDVTATAAADGPVQ